VTIEPRPPKMPPIWVSGGSRVPDPTDHDVPVIAPTVMDRIVKAGHWLSRCSGKQEWVKRDWLQLQQRAQDMGKDPRKLLFGHCNFTHLVDTNNHAKAVAQSKAPFLRAMGSHRTYEHLQECYMIGGIDAINARIDDLRKSGLQYIVLGPVSDDPKQIDLMAKRVVKHFK
jgi:alkanesulfonate monooxygenase SsuD/methylene tetrahydromethanopterin reductase-like flavin-dependent oxidoreductase (luciferase family)